MRQHRRPPWPLVLALLLPAPGAARDLDPRAVAGMSLDELLATPVTAAALAPQTTATAPASVTTFTGEEIKNLGVQTVEELLNFVPGIQASRTASRSDYGIGVRGTGGVGVPNDVLFLLDGRRLNEDYTGSALVFARYLSVGNLERVEVIRGPGSALYGSNAFLAVVNLVTREDASELYLSAGEPGHREGRLSLAWEGEEARASLYVQGFRDDGQSFPDPAAGAGDTRDPRSGRTVQGTLALGDTRLELHHGAARVEDFYLFQVTPSYRGNEAWSEDTRLTLRHTLVDAPDRRLEATLGGRHLSGESVGRPFSAAEMARFGLPQGPFLGGTDVQLSEHDAALDGEARVAPGHRLYAGLAYRDTHLETLSNRNNYETTDFLGRMARGPAVPVRFYGEVTSTAPFGPEGEHRRVRSAYLQDRWSVSDALEVTLGARWDDYSDFGSSLNPRAAAVYTHSPRDTWKVLYGEAFRAPTVTELGATNGPVRIGNPDLEAEKVRTLELAWVRDSEALRTTATAYHSRLSERIVDVPIPGTPMTTLENAGDLHVSGLELEAQARLGPDWLLRATWSHALKADEDPRTTPRNAGSLIANYRRGRLNLNLSALYRSATRTATTPSAELDGHWRLNTHLRYRLDGAVLIAGVRNLLDEDHATPTRTDLPGGTPQRGRQIRLALEVPLGE